MVVQEKYRFGQADASGSIAPPAAACREELGRILASTAFRKTPRLCTLLRYICDNSLSGSIDELTEQHVGIHVFERAPGYNSGEDTIVRGTARHLRERLELYYSLEGRDNPVRVAVPKGGYVALFTPNSRQEAVADAAEGSFSGDTGTAISVQAAGPEGTTAWPTSAKHTVIVLTVALVLLTLVLGVLLWSASKSKSQQIVSAGPSLLWKELFTIGRKTLIVPGDAGLDTYVSWEQHPVSLQDYSNQNYQHEVTVSRPPSSGDVPLGIRSVTPMADLSLVSELVRLPNRIGVPGLEDWTEVRYARDLAVGDTHDNNLILIGTETFNPWVTLYQPQLDFQVRWNSKNDRYSVTDSAPRPGEPGVYTYNRDTPGTKALALVAFLDNSQGEGHVLLIEGTSMGTTYCAMNFFNHEQLWKPALNAAKGPDGKLRNFEVLLSSDFVRGGVSNTRVVAVHVH